MNTHAVYDWEILRSSIEVPDSVWEPIVQTDVIFIDTACKDTKLTSTDEMRDYIGANDESTNGPIRAAPGMTYDIMVAFPGNPTGHPAGWSQGVQTDYGVSLCRRLNVKPHPNKQYAFVVTIETSNMGRTKLKTLGTYYAGPPAIRMNVQNGLTMKPLFRINSNEVGDVAALVIPGDEEVDSGADPQCFKYSTWVGDSGGSAEVGGKPIDMAGQPMNTPVESRQMQLEVLRRWGHLAWPSSGPAGVDWKNGTQLADWEVCLPDWDGSVGSRNIDEQWGFDPGYLKLDAINVLPLHHDFRIYQYLFIYDGHKHAQQFAPTLPNGSHIIDDASLTSIRGCNVNEVYWNQPFLGGYRYLEADWADDEWDFLETFVCS